MTHSHSPLYLNFSILETLPHYPLGYTYCSMYYCLYSLGETDPPHPSPTNHTAIVTWNHSNSLPILSLHARSKRYSKPRHHVFKLLPQFSILQISTCNQSSVTSYSPIQDFQPVTGYRVRYLALLRTDSPNQQQTNFAILLLSSLRPQCGVVFAQLDNRPTFHIYFRKILSIAAPACCTPPSGVRACASTVCASTSHYSVSYKALDNFFSMIHAMQQNPNTLISSRNSITYTIHIQYHPSSTVLIHTHLPMVTYHGKSDTLACPKFHKFINKLFNFSMIVISISNDNNINIAHSL